MAGLWFLAPLLHRNPDVSAFAEESLAIGWPWIAAGIVATLVFVGVVGPGLRLAA